MATLARESRSANSCIDCLSVCAQYPQLHQPVRCAVKRASCSKAGPELTDNEAGYGHSMILVNSDDSCDLRPVSMMCRAKMWETKLKARSGAWPDFRCLDSRSQDRHLGNGPNRAPICMFSRDVLVAPNRYSSDRTLLRAKKYNPGRRRRKASNRQCSYLKDSPTCLALEPKYSVPGYRQSCRVLGIRSAMAVHYKPHNLFDLLVLDELPGISIELGSCLWWDLNLFRQRSIRPQRIGRRLIAVRSRAATAAFEPG